MGILEPKHFGNKRLANMFYYSRTNEAESRSFISSLVNPAEFIYVGFNDDDRARYGSIGILRYSKLGADRTKWPTPAIIMDRLYEYSDNLCVEFDGGKTIKVDLWSENLMWLEGYSGPTHYVFTRKAKPAPVEVFDRLGEKLGVDDFVAFVGRAAYTTGMGDLYFGTVTRISDKGTVYVKNIKLSDDDRSSEMRLTQPDRATKLDRDILNKLILKKLTF